MAMFKLLLRSLLLVAVGLLSVPQSVPAAEPQPESCCCADCAEPQAVSHSCVCPTTMGCVAAAISAVIPATATLFRPPQSSCEYFSVESAGPVRAERPLSPPPKRVV